MKLRSPEDRHAIAIICEYLDGDWNKAQEVFDMLIEHGGMKIAAREERERKRARWFAWLTGIPSLLR